MTDRELLQMALLKMEYMMNNGEWYKPEEIIEALRARLTQPEPDDGYCQVCDGNHCTAKNGCVALDNPRAQPEPEPVAWVDKAGAVIPHSHKLFKPDIFTDYTTPLYTAPPQREWQSLTDEEIQQTLWKELGIGQDDDEISEFARAIEAKLKEKNT